jgi:diadenylate cyclase
VPDDDDSNPVLWHLARLAPGTPLREGFERILRGRTGALVVLGAPESVMTLCTGGFPLDLPFSPTALRELAKMDGAIVLTADTERIVRAGVHLMPDSAIPTIETGTRHRTADRVSRQTGVPVVSVSASMATISLYVGDHRRVVEQSETILTKADQALQALERYRSRLWELANRLSSLEVQDQVTVRDFAYLAQRLEMVRRLDAEVNAYVVELGTDGRLLTLQLHDLSAGVAELRELLERDYRPPDSQRPFGLAALADLSTGDLLDPLVVARSVGFSTGEQLDTKISTRGYRQLSQINRLPTALGVRLIEHFGSLQGLFGASSTELQEVEGVGEQRARIIRDGLVRLAEAAYSEPVV